MTAKKQDTTLDDVITTIGDLATMVSQQFDATAERFEAMDERFDKMDQRFDKMDERFDKMDDRFDKMDERFDKMEKRLDSFQYETSYRLSALEEKTDQLVAKVEGLDKDVLALYGLLEKYQKTTSVQGKKQLKKTLEEEILATYEHVQLLAKQAGVSLPK